MEQADAFVAVWTDDWIFFSRIDGVARHFGGRVLMVKTAAQCEPLLAGGQMQGMLVDLQVAGADLERIVRSVRTGVRVVGYGSHIDAASLRVARELGLDPVMPRSLFVEKMPKEWQAWFGQAPRPIPPAVLGSLP